MRRRGDTRTVGNFLKRDLTLRLDDIQVFARAGTEDLGYYWRSHKPAVDKWFEPRPNEVVVDIGANVGLWSLLSATGGARVFAIEPNPGTYSVLKRNRDANRLNGLTVSNIAISGQDGIGKLTTFQRSTGASTLGTDIRSNLTGGSVESALVTTTTLDSYCSLNGIDSVDWLLIDVEGHEAEVLRSGTRTLKKTRRLILEVSFGERSRVCREILSAVGMRVTEKRGQSSINEYWLVEGRDERHGSESRLAGEGT